MFGKSVLAFAGAFAVKQVVKIVWPEATIEAAIVASYALADIDADDDDEQQQQQQQQQAADDNKAAAPPTIVAVPATPADADATATVTVTRVASPRRRRPTSAPRAQQAEQPPPPQQQQQQGEAYDPNAVAKAVRAAIKATTAAGHRSQPVALAAFLADNFNNNPAGPAARLPVAPNPALFCPGRPRPAASYPAYANHYAARRANEAQRVAREAPRAAREAAAAGAAPAAPVRAPVVVLAAPGLAAPEPRGGVLTPAACRLRAVKSLEHVQAAREARRKEFGAYIPRLDTGRGAMIREDPEVEAVLAARYAPQEEEARARPGTPPPPASALAGARQLLPETLVAPPADECKLAYGTYGPGYDFAFARGTNVRTGIEHGGFGGLLRAPSRGSIPAALAAAVVAAFAPAPLVRFLDAVLLAPLGQMQAVAAIAFF